MDFKTVLSSLIKQFNDQDVRYGLMGGFALGLWGVTRATVDLDFLIDRRDMGKVDAVMKTLGYSVKFNSDNVTQYESPLAVFGEIDYLHAFRESGMSMLERTVERDVFAGDLKIRVLIPEDIIGLKMQAIKNNPSRKAADILDIKMLIEARGQKLDWALIERYTALLDAHDILAEFRK
jgi:hypothetical protein